MSLQKVKKNKFNTHLGEERVNVVKVIDFIFIFRRRGGAVWELLCALSASR